MDDGTDPARLPTYVDILPNYASRLRLAFFNLYFGIIESEIFRRVTAAAKFFLIRSESF